MADPFAELDATAQADLVRRGDTTAGELAEAAIRRIEAINPQLNAVIIPLFEKARAQAKAAVGGGPFAGVPLLIKDLFCHTAGDPYHAGMRFLRDRKWIAKDDTYLAAKFRAAGFICVGRTNVPELGPLPTTEPLAYGPTRNPWDLSRSPGGSSGGSGAAVAARLVAVAHGNDGGGSIRIPASANGLVGLKPSRGRTSLGPEYGQSWNGAVAEHVLTRSVRDSAAVLDAVCGMMPGDPYVAPAPRHPFASEVGAPPGRLRIGLLTHVPSGVAAVHADCVAATEQAAALLTSLGHDVEPAFPAALGEAEFQQHFGNIVMAWTARDLAQWSACTSTEITAADVEPHTWQLALAGRALSASDFIIAQVWLDAFTRRVVRWWEDGYDLLLTPTMAEPPAKLGEMAASPENPMQGFMRSLPFVAFTAVFNVTGQPAISLPLSWNANGLPIGVQLVAPFAREDMLLRVAAQLEQAQPWSDRRPPIHA